MALDVGCVKCLLLHLYENKIGDEKTEIEIWLEKKSTLVIQKRGALIAEIKCSNVIYGTKSCLMAL